MSNLIRSEWFKLTRNRSFWLILAVLFVSAVGYCVMNALDDPSDGGALDALSGLDMLTAAMGGNMYIIKIGLCVLAGFFVSSEYSSGTMKRAVSSGYSRSRIIVAKMLVFIAGSLLVALVFPLICLGLGSLLFGVGSLPDVSAAEYIVRCLGLTVTLSAAFAAITALIAVIFNDSGKTIGIGIIFFFFIDGVFVIIGNHLPFVLKVYEYSVLNEINHYADTAMASRDVTLSVVIPLATLIVFVALGVYAFRRKEIK
jgi:ABC-2 type transport system permease protein